jgi:hypothetical protein
MADIFLVNSGASIYYSSLVVSIPNTGYDPTNYPPTININDIQNKYSGSWR